MNYKIKYFYYFLSIIFFIFYIYFHYNEKGINYTDMFFLVLSIWAIIKAKGKTVV